MVLQIEHIFERTLKTVRPEMCSAFGVDELPSDTDAISGLAHAAFEYVAHLARGRPASRPRPDLLW